MFVCIDKNIGSLVSSDESLPNDKYVECDGSKVNRKDCPELFKALCVHSETIKLEDMSHILPGVKFYEIAK